MRITLLIGSLTGGGAERVVCHLANYLAKQQHIVEILTVYADPQRRTDLRNEASKEGAKKLMEVLEELHIPFI